MKIAHLKYVIAAMLCVATMINYADRLALGVVQVELKNEFGMNDEDYSHVVALFFLAYAIMYAGSGYVVDRLGTRLGYAVFIIGWSAAQMLHGLARGKWSLAGCRVLLGLAEPGNWPAAAKAVGEWFPARQRALGVGIFNSGSSIGSAIANPVVAFLTLYFGWRYSFVFTGVVGLLWLALWLVMYYPPHRHPWVSREDYERVKDELRPSEGTAREPVDWRKVIRMRGCYTLILTRFFTDPVIYFVIFWLPAYLRNVRGFDLAMVGQYAWVPYIFGDIGYPLGGWLSGRLIGRGWALPRARKFVMAVGAAFLPVAILAPFAPAPWMALATMCFVTFGHAFWVANLQALPIDLFEGREIGTATGFSGMGGAIAGALATLGTGWMVQNFSYTPVFLIAGLMHPLSAVLTYILLPDHYFGKSAGRP